MRRKTVVYRNPVAKAMLQERQAPKVIPPKKGGKAKRNERMNIEKTIKVRVSDIGQTKKHSDE